MVAAGGLDLEAVAAWVGENGYLRCFPGRRTVSRTEVLLTPSDILVPAALERQITDENAGLLPAS